jgi:hypothetical protein
VWVAWGCVCFRTDEAAAVGWGLVCEMGTSCRFGTCVLRRGGRRRSPCLRAFAMRWRGRRACDRPPMHILSKSIQGLQRDLVLVGRSSSSSSSLCCCSSSAAAHYMPAVLYTDGRLRRHSRRMWEFGQTSSRSTASAPTARGSVEHRGNALPASAAAAPPLLCVITVRCHRHH